MRWMMLTCQMLGTPRHMMPFNSSNDGSNALDDVGLSDFGFDTSCDAIQLKQRRFRCVG
jgi:hypothetical protein